MATHTPYAHAHTHVQYYFEDSGGFIHLSPAQLALSHTIHAATATATATAATSMSLGARKKIKGRVHLCSKVRVMYVM